MGHAAAAWMGDTSATCDSRPESPERVDLALEGMTCAACAARIESTLNHHLRGVEAAVNFATESARVDYDRARADVDAMLAAAESRARFGPS